MGSMAPADCATPAIVVGSNLLKWGRPSCEQGAVARSTQFVQTVLPTCHLAPNDSLSLLWRWLLPRLVRPPVLVFHKLT